MRGRLGRVEQRVSLPNVGNIGNTQMRVFEKVRGLSIDFERVIIVE